MKTSDLDLRLLHAYRHMFTGNKCTDTHTHIYTYTIVITAIISKHIKQHSYIQNLHYTPKSVQILSNNNLTPITQFHAVFLLVLNGMAWM